MSQKDYVKEFKGKYSYLMLCHFFERLCHLNVAVIGDTIIDHYIFSILKGRAIKDPILSVEYDSEEYYPGGVLAVANHIADFVGSVTVFTIVGDRRPMQEFIEKSLKPNIQLLQFVKKNSPTIVKQRYLDAYRGHKLFKIEYINDAPISEELCADLERAFNELDKYDIVIVSDFGHGFLNERLRRKIEEKSKFLCVNAQSNSANMGYNYFTLYKKADFVSMDEQEARLPLLRRFEDIELVAQELAEKFHIDPFLITRGKNGSNFYLNGKFYQAPILTQSVKDTVGAGDASFALSSLAVYAKADADIIPFLANCAGGIASNIIGNRESISKESLHSFIRGLYNGME